MDPTENPVADESKVADRTVIIANRMPISGEVSQGPGGKPEYNVKVPVGGLAVAFSQTHDTSGGQRNIFIGTEPTPSGPQDLRAKPLTIEELRAADAQGFIERLPFEPYGVGANVRETDAFYGKVANETNWLLMHFMNEGLQLFGQAIKPLDRDALARAEEFTSSYVDQVLTTISAEKNPRIWFQDYHFMLAPKMARERAPDASIGYFHHIPFPPPFSNEMKTDGPLVRLQPKHAKLFVEGLLGADHIGFHTNEYADNFLQWASELQESRHLPEVRKIDFEKKTVTVGDRVTQVSAHPISVDADYIERLARDSKVIDRAKQIRAEHKGKFLVFGADRLDLTKNTPERVNGWFQAITHPESSGLLNPMESVLLHYSTPTREQLRAFAQHLRDMEETVFSVSQDLDEYSAKGSLKFHFKGVSYPDVIAHALAADVLLATPGVDGFNLMGIEYALVSKLSMEVMDRKVPAVPVVGMGAGCWVGLGKDARKVEGFPGVFMGDVVGVYGSQAGSVANGIRFAHHLATEDPESLVAGLERAATKVREHSLAEWIKAETSGIDLAAVRNRRVRSEKLSGALSSLNNVADHDQGLVAEIGTKLQRSSKSLVVVQADAPISPREISRIEVDEQKFASSLADFASQDGRNVLILSGWGADQIKHFLPSDLLAGKNIFLSSHRGATLYDFSTEEFVTDMHVGAAGAVENIAKTLARSPKYRTKLPEGAKLITGQSSIGFYLGECPYLVDDTGYDRVTVEDIVKSVFNQILEEDTDYNDALRIWFTGDYVGLIPKPAAMIGAGAGGRLAMPNPITSSRFALKEVVSETNPVDIAHFSSRGSLRIRPSNTVRLINEEYGGDTIYVGQASAISNSRYRVASLNSMYAMLELASQDRKGLSTD